MAYDRLEPIGNDWDRTARQTLFLLQALGADVSEDFIERFKPGQSARAMSDEEIHLEVTKFKRMKGGK
jgi:hypothetical protein